MKSLHVLFNLPAASDTSIPERARVKGAGGMSHLHSDGDSKSAMMRLNSFRIHLNIELTSRRLHFVSKTVQTSKPRWEGAAEARERGKES